MLQVDGYAGYNRLTKAARTGGKPITLAYCWAHARRELIKATSKAGSPIAAEALARIAGLYAIEKESTADTPTTAWPCGANAPLR